MKVLALCDRLVANALGNSHASPGDSTFLATMPLPRVKTMRFCHAAKRHGGIMLLRTIDWGEQRV